MTITYLLRIPTRPEMFEAACEVMAGVMPTVQQEDGCIRYEFYTASEDRSAIHGIEIWRDEDALAAHSTQPHMLTFREKLKPTMSGPLEARRLTALR